MLLRQGLTPFQISQIWERNINTVLPYLDRAVGDKIPYGIPITKAEILRSIPRQRRGIIASAITKGEDPNDLWIRHNSLWSSLAEVRADFEVVRKYGEEPSGSSPGDRLGYLFEDIWKIETRMASCLSRALSARYGPDWWQKIATPRLSEDQKNRLTSIQDVTLLDLMKLSRLFWDDVNSSLGQYASTPFSKFKDDIETLNKIRNALFHPARFSSFHEDDYEYARKVRAKLLDE